MAKRKNAPQLTTTKKGRTAIENLETLTGGYKNKLSLILKTDTQFYFNLLIPI